MDANLWKPIPGSIIPPMPARFFAPDLVGPDQPLALPPDEAAHLVRVLRLSGGDIVSVFDGRGVEYLARVETAEPRRVVVRPFESVKPPPEPKVALTVAQGLLKGRKFDAVVRDLTMVGAVAVQPLVTDHSEARERDPERWMRVAVASAKQCRRAVVPLVRFPVSFHQLVDKDDAPLRLLLVEPEVAESSDSLGRLRNGPTPSAATLAVGPEGGWSTEEVTRACAAGFVPVTIGRRTLRADAVVVCAVSVLLFLWGDL